MLTIFRSWYTFAPLLSCVWEYICLILLLEVIEDGRRQKTLIYERRIFGVVYCNRKMESVRTRQFDWLQHSLNVLDKTNIPKRCKYSFTYIESPGRGDGHTCCCEQQ